MAMLAGEKYWEKSRFAKAEKQYYEMLSQDIYFESCVEYIQTDKIPKVRHGKILSDKPDFEKKIDCITSRNKLDKIERFLKFEKKNKQMALGCPQDSSINRKSILVSEIAKAREHIKNSLEKMDGISCVEATIVPSNLLERIQLLEEENANLKQIISKLNDLSIDSQKRIAALEGLIKCSKPVAQSVTEDDDGVDLFASDSDEESEEAARIREERLAAYAAKKSKKPVLIAKSSLVLDVKPWDDETDLQEMENLIRKISTDGLLWGASKLVPVAFGISKLSISCVVEDDKVSIDWLTEEIEKNEEFVQSVDVAAFNKI